MAESAPYGKMEDPNGISKTDDDDALLDHPPPYSESDIALKGDLGAPSTAPPPTGNPMSYYPVQQPMAPMYPQYPQPVPVSPPAAPQVTNVVVGVNSLAPGVCSVCRKGKIKDTASCCTWFWCLVLLPLGIIPGLIAFCCCCRRPKCNHCGFSI